MVNVDKLDMWGKIQTLDIQILFQENIFDLINTHLDRVEFVKDHLGLRDFLFIAEKGTDYMDELFLVINADVNREKTLEDNELVLFNKYQNKAHLIVVALREFFHETDRTLTIGIGFNKSEPTEEESISIEYAFQEGMIQSRLKAHRDLRIKKFPKWYQENAKMPEDVEFFTIEEELNWEINNYQSERDAWMKKINLSLEEKNEANFIEHAASYKKFMEKHTH